MRKRSQLASSLALAIAVSIAGCGSDSGGDTKTTSDTIKLGILTSKTGAASGGFQEVQMGADARIAAYTDAGGTCKQKITTVLGDDASSPQGALAAAQKLVQQDKVFAVLPSSSFFYGAGQYAGTEAASTPFVGAGFDGGPQWSNKDFKNLYNAIGSVDYEKVSTTFGDYFKAIGGTTIAAVGVDTPSSSNAALSAVQSAEQAGLKRGYVNVKLPIGSSDVGAVVLGIKNSGADVVYLPVTPETAFAIVGGLAQAGYKPKRVLLATGYGSDLLKSAPAVQAAQGVGFVTTSAPITAGTPGTKALAEAVKKANPSAAASNPEGLPSFAFTVGYLTTDAFLHGLEQAGCEASQSKFISTMRDDSGWDADGLYAKPLDFGKLGGVAAGNGPGNCIYVSILEGETFVADPEAAPVCGTMLDEKVKN